MAKVELKAHRNAFGVLPAVETHQNRAQRPLEVGSARGVRGISSATVSHLARGQYLTVRRTVLGALEGEVLELLSSPLHYQTFALTPQEVAAREAGA